MVSITRTVDGVELNFPLTLEEIEAVRTQDKIEWAKNVLSNYESMFGDGYKEVVGYTDKLILFAELLESKNLESIGYREIEAIQEIFPNSMILETRELPFSWMRSEDIENLFGNHIYKQEENSEEPEVGYDVLDQYFKVELDEDYCNDYFDELVACYKNGWDIGDFDGWTDLEKLLDKKINADQYHAANAELWEQDIDTIGIFTECKDRPELKEEAMGIVRKVFADNGWEL